MPTPNTPTAAPETKPADRAASEATPGLSVAGSIAAMLETPVQTSAPTEEATEETPETETAPETETEEAPETETPEETEEVPSEETAEEEPAETEETPEEEVPGNAAMQKRIDKLTAQKGEAERRIEELEAQLSERSAAPVRDSADPLGHISTEQELAAELSAARTAKQWAIRNPQGGVIKNAAGEEVEVSEEQRNEVLANAEMALDSAPQAESRIQATKAADAELRKLVPLAFTKGNEHYDRLEKAMRTHGPLFAAIARTAGTSPRTIAYATLVGLGAMEKAKAGEKPPGTHGKPGQPASPATRPAARKAPPIPQPRTAPAAPAKDVRAREALDTSHAGKPGAVAKAVEALL